MKVGTDSILLASLVNDLSTNKRIPIIEKNVLDVGTGCGIIALCMAQIFSKSDIKAIDIDKNSIIEANSNFLQSPFANRLQAEQISFQQLSEKESNRYNLIISNPPFFETKRDSKMVPQTKRRLNARHNAELSLQDFVLSSDKLLAANSIIAIILPPFQTAEITKLFRAIDYNVVNQIHIYPNIDKPIEREVSIFSNAKIDKASYSKFYIRIDNTYTEQYKVITAPFLL